MRLLLKSGKGFTFIEMIIAVTIFSIIAVSIYSTFNAGIRVWLKTNPMIEANQSTRLFFAIIARDLKNAVKYPDIKDVPNFEGESDRMVFMTFVDIPDEEAHHTELAKVIYEFKTVSEGRSQLGVVKRGVATGKEGLDEKQAKTMEILNGVDVKEFGFRYAYIEGSADNKDYSYQWKDKWEEDDAGNIPRGVKAKAGKFEKTIFIPMGTLGGVKK
jgi:prepilin-type N-terminal cleavage/methylation domain-containing protein